MLSLPQVLYEAQRHSVDEIAIERGEPVTFHGEQGALVLGEPLSDNDISDGISMVLTPEQQAELAVAGMVEFYVEGYAEWNLVAETTEEGVVIRGRMRSGQAPLDNGAPMNLPPLQRFEPDGGADVPQSSGSVLQQTTGRSTRWDVGLAGAIIDTPTPAPEAAEVPEPPESPESPESPEPPASRPLSDTILYHEREVPQPEPVEDDEAIDFALVGRAAGSDDEPLHSEAPPPVGPAVLDEPGGDLATDSTVPRINRAPRAPRAPAHGRDTLASHADALGPGTVIYLAGLGLGQDLFESRDEAFDIIDDDTWAAVTTLPFEELSVGHGYLVRMEDPSRCAPWLLRRLEEGAKIVVEGRARTAAGARRTLLGSEATSHFCEWLDAHPQLWLYLDGDTWRLEPL